MAKLMLSTTRTSLVCVQAVGGQVGRLLVCQPSKDGSGYLLFGASPTDEHFEYQTAGVGSPEIEGWVVVATEILGQFDVDSSVYPPVLRVEVEDVLGSMDCVADFLRNLAPRPVDGGMELVNEADIGDDEVDIGDDEVDIGDDEVDIGDDEADIGDGSPGDESSVFDNAHLAKELFKETDDWATIRAKCRTLESRRAGPATPHWARKGSEYGRDRFVWAANENYITDRPAKNLLGFYWVPNQRGETSLCITWRLDAMFGTLKALSETCAMVWLQWLSEHSPRKGGPLIHNPSAQKSRVKIVPTHDDRMGLADAWAVTAACDTGVQENGWEEALSFMWAFVDPWAHQQKLNHSTDLDQPFDLMVFEVGSAVEARKRGNQSDWQTSIEAAQHPLLRDRDVNGVWVPSSAIARNDHWRAWTFTLEASNREPVWKLTEVAHIEDALHLLLRHSPLVGGYRAECEVKTGAYHRDVAVRLTVHIVVATADPSSFDGLRSEIEWLLWSAAWVVSYPW